MRALCLLGSALLVVAARKSLAPITDGYDRIIGGKPAKLGQFPHQALLRLDELGLCGGSLISTTTVLTAAHCTQGRKTFAVTLGAIDQVLPEPSSWTVVSPWAIEHPDYQVELNIFGLPGGTHNDVALIFLPQPAPLTRFIKLVGLPSTYEVHNSFVGRNAVISGWGDMNATVPEAARHLQWTEMTVIPNKICQKFFLFTDITEWHLCARSMDSGLYRGDSGSALVLRFGRRYKQIGIASFVNLGKPVGTPAVFARVTSVIDWIKLKSEDSL